MKWNYKSPVTKSHGYEDVINILSKYNKEYYANCTDDEQNQIVEEIFSVYRGRNIFPIQYYNEKGILYEIHKAIDKDVSFDGDVLDLKYNQGSSLCRFLFPNLSTVDCKGSKNNSPYSKFMDDHKLKRAIDFCLRHKTSNKPTMPSGIKDGLEMLGGNVATNFKPMNAKALYERYTPKNGVIYDFSCGFGGRMLGALSSKNNYRYVGVEPNTETFNNLLILGSYIEKATGTKNRYTIKKIGSESITVNKESCVDFAFSSPPYFSLEKYSDESTQCYIKFPTLSTWFDGYVKATIHNIHKLLKKDRFYAVNIADFKLGNETVWLVDEWVRLSEQCGLSFHHKIDMKLQSRRGIGHSSKNGKTKQEGIFVFRKN